MSSNRALYEQVILEHNKNPRNYRDMPAPDRSIEAHNPLCGDHFKVHIKLEGDTISDVCFTGSGCAIAKSSASLMTSMLKGKSKAEAKALFAAFHKMITSEPGAPFDEDAVGKMRVFSGVRDFPIRIKCATLAWHALQAAIEGEKNHVTTE